MRATMLCVLALLLVVTACYRHTFTVGAGAPDGRLVYDQWEHFWIAGLINHQRYDLGERCPGGDATIDARQTFLNGLVAALTAGIYTPTTVQIRCADGRQASLKLDGLDVALMVGDRRFVYWVATEMPERLPEVVAARERRGGR